MPDPPADQSTEADVSSLRRRLERERAARREAEEIAERTTRALYQNQAELRLLEMVAKASNEATTIDEVMDVAVNEVCTHTGWPVGHVYLRSRDFGDYLVPTGIWCLEDAQRYEVFRRETEATRFGSGIGLPGRVLARGQAAWIVDVTNDPNFPRADAAQAVGLRAAFAFPVLIRAEVVAVLEFFSPDSAEPDELLLELMAYIGTQLGRVVERKWGEEELAWLSRQTELLLSCAGEGICGLDSSGATTFVNPAASRMLGWRQEELIGRPIHEVVHDSSTAHAAEECPLYAAAKNGEARPHDDAFLRKNGGNFPVEYISTPIVEGDQLVGAVVTFNDVTERRRFESKLQHLADHDALTGLFNRRRFEEELSRQVAYAVRYGSGGAALVLDLDNFKFVNDTFGHQAGDEVIRSVAGVLTERLRDTDVLARLGGDEFAILLPQTDAERAESVADDLLQTVRRLTVSVADQPMRVTTSIGVRVLGEGHLTAEELLVEADRAMYDAKDAGRDRVALYTEESAERVRRQSGLPWTDRIRRALKEDLFVLHCQPILDLAANEVSQYEILLRLADEGEDVVLPGAFLPSAERFGLIQDIDRWVVQNAIRVLADRHRRGQEVNLLLEINLSGKSVGDTELPGLIERELAASSVPPESLIFEITETAAIANMEQARKFAKRLTELGCRLALDDFGAGFGSFYYLKYLTLDYLKIDGDFIENLPRSPMDQRMVKAMVEVARGLEMKTIAEFVGEDETVRLLRKFGVDYAQGYHVGRPRPVSAYL